MSTKERKQGVIIQISKSDVVNVTEICRLCANESEKLVHIYSEEGIANELATKMNLYLPIKVAETDDLPLQCCWGCASTVLAYHELVLASVEADRKLRSHQFVTTTEALETSSYNSPDTVIADESTPPNEDSQEDTDGVETEQMTASLNAFCQTHNSPEPTETVLIPEESKKDKTYVPIYFTTDENSHFDNYMTSLEHPLITETSLTENTGILKGDDLELIDHKYYNFSEDNVVEDEIIEEITELDKTEDKNKPSEEYYTCHICSLTITSKEDLKDHFTQAHPKEDMSAEKSIIEKKKSRREKRRNKKLDQALINEAKINVDGRVYYNCKMCGKSLHSPYTYIWHVRIHTGERPFVCNLCGKQFRVSQGLIRHVRETHEGIKNFPCDLCGRMFASKRNVEEHRRIHTNERPYVCDLCGKSFKQKASLFVHNRSHTDSFPFKCSYCNQGFRTKPPLLLHITRHTGEKPYPCDVCGRRFRIKYELKRHRLIHSDEKPFSCNACALSFRQKRYLKNHIKLNHSNLNVKIE